MGSLKNKFDRFVAGFAAGLLGSAAGFFGFASLWNISNGTNMRYFIDEVFLGTNFYQSKIITVSVLLNVLLFYIFMKLDWLNFCKGILATIILAVIAVIYYW